jgi:hypothetical protein
MQHDLNPGVTIHTLQVSRDHRHWLMRGRLVKASMQRKSVKLFLKIKRGHAKCDPRQKYKLQFQLLKLLKDCRGLELKK